MLLRKISITSHATNFPCSVYIIWVLFLKRTIPIYVRWIHRVFYRYFKIVGSAYQARNILWGRTIHCLQVTGQMTEMSMQKNQWSIFLLRKNSNPLFKGVDWVASKLLAESRVFYAMYSFKSFPMLSVFKFRIPSLLFVCSLNFEKRSQSVHEE